MQSPEKTDPTHTEVTMAESIDVRQPGANMLWVTIDWGDKEEVFDVKATPENRMLFDRDQFTFDGKSLYTLLFGDEHSRAVLMDDPFVAIKPGPYKDTYRVWAGDEVTSVLTPPSKSKEVLQGVVTCTEHDAAGPLRDIYTTIQEEQVNRNALLALLEKDYFSDSDRIEPKADGFVIDDYFLLTWEAEFFIYTETWKEGAFTPRGDPKEKPGEFREITVQETPETCDMELGGAIYRMNEDEWLFVRRLQWILNWRDNMDDAEIASVERTVPILQEHNI